MTSDDPRYLAQLDTWRDDVARGLAAERRRVWARWALTLAGLAGTFGALWAVTAR